MPLSEAQIETFCYMVYRKPACIWLILQPAKVSLVSTIFETYLHMLNQISNIEFKSGHSDFPPMLWEESYIGDVNKDFLPSMNKELLNTQKIIRLFPYFLTG